MQDKDMQRIARYRHYAHQLDDNAHYIRMQSEKLLNIKEDSLEWSLDVILNNYLHAIMNINNHIAEFHKELRKERIALLTENKILTNEIQALKTKLKV